MKNKSHHSCDQAQQDQLKDSVVGLESLVFIEKNNVVYIGGEAVTEQMRSLLRDQAKQLQSSNLYEIINATAIDEAHKLFLQSGNMEHVQYAKALIYWNKVLVKMINALAK